MRLALAGMRMSSASSTARHDATACTTVQTPQMRCVKAHASRGSRPCMMISIPRNCVEVAHAFVIRPFSACASMRRWPSILVRGSTTILVVAMAFSFLLSGLGLQDRELAALPDLMDARRDGVRRHTGRGAHRERRTDRVGIALDTKAGHVGEPAVERRHRVPEVALGAAEAGVPGADGPAGAGVPEKNRAGRERRGTFATDVVQTPSLARGLVIERFDELAGVEVGAARTLIVNPRAVREQRSEEHTSEL